jgi:hypothetical protein
MIVDGPARASVRAPDFGTRFGTHSLATRSVDSSRPRVLLLLRMERTGIEPVTSDLQIPDFKPRLGEVRSVQAKLRWLGEVEIGYSGTRFGTRFCVCGARARVKFPRAS